MKKLTGALLALIILLTIMSASAAEEFPIRLGDRGDQVMALKERMYELGYFSSRKFDVKYNETTAERVSQLQKHNGLTETGEVDEELWALIFSDECLAADEPERPKEEAAQAEAFGTEDAAVQDNRQDQAESADQQGEAKAAETASSLLPASSVTEYASLFPALTEDGFLQ